MKFWDKGLTLETIHSQWLKILQTNKFPMDIHIKVYNWNHWLLSLYAFKHLHYSVTLSSGRWISWCLLRPKYNLAVQNIFQVCQNRCNFCTNDAIFNFFRILKKRNLCNIVFFTPCSLFYLKEMGSFLKPRQGRSCL